MGPKVTLVEVENISRNWKRFHILGLAAAAVFGIISGISLSTLFEDAEPLCGSVSLSVVTQPKPSGRFTIINDTYVYLVVSASADTLGVCSFSEYTFISSFIFAVIWMVFFFMCGPGGKSRDGVSLPQPWRIVPPATVFSCLFFFITLGAGFQMSSLFKTLCSTFHVEMTKLLSNPRSECQDLSLFNEISEQGTLSIDTIISIAEISGWLCVVSWAFTIALCLARLLTGPDFRQLLKVAEIPLSNKNKPIGSYKELTHSSTSSLASSPRVENKGVITGTSLAEIHAVPQCNDETEEQSEKGFANNENAVKKHVRLNPHVLVRDCF